MNQTAKLTFNAKNLTARVLLATYSLPASSETILAAIRIRLTSVVAAGSSYTIIVQGVDEDSITADIDQQQLVLTGGTGPLSVEFAPVALKAGETLNVYGLSSNSGDTAVAGVCWIFDSATHNLTPSGVTAAQAGLATAIRNGLATSQQITDLQAHGDASWAKQASAIGPGGALVTVTIAVDGNPVADADVWISSDSAGAQVVAGTLQTNSQGRATFLLDAGSTYYLWMQKDGINPIKGQMFVAEAD